MVVESRKVLCHLSATSHGFCSSECTLSYNQPCEQDALARLLASQSLANDIFSVVLAPKGSERRRDLLNGIWPSLGGARKPVE